MTETFLILLAAGVMLAAAVSDPKQVTLQWLRLCGIIALALVALAVFAVVGLVAALFLPAPVAAAEDREGQQA